MDTLLLIQFVILGSITGYSAARNWQQTAMAGQSLHFTARLKEQLGDLIPAGGAGLLVWAAALNPSGLTLTIAWLATMALYNYRLPYNQPVNRAQGKR